jgi:hypothetical protein
LAKIILTKRVTDGKFRSLKNFSWFDFEEHGIYLFRGVLCKVK